MMGASLGLPLDQATYLFQAIAHHTPTTPRFQHGIRIDCSIRRPMINRLFLFSSLLLTSCCQQVLLSGGMLYALSADEKLSRRAVDGSVNSWTTAFDQGILGQSLKKNLVHLGP